MKNKKNNDNKGKNYQVKASDFKKLQIFLSKNVAKNDKKDDSSN